MWSFTILQMHCLCRRQNVLCLTRNKKLEKPKKQASVLAWSSIE